MVLDLYLGLLLNKYVVTIGLGVVTTYKIGVIMMYCVIQEIKLKKPDMKGKSKYIEPYTRGLGNEVHYSYKMSNECFERNIHKAYKISIHHSYRENGKVKKKQYVICTMGYYSIATLTSWFGDYCLLKSKADTIGIEEDEIIRLVTSKLDPIIDTIEAEYKQTEEYRVTKKNKEIIDRHNVEEYKFNQKYGKGYDQCYDVFGELKNESKLNQILEDYKARKEYEEKSKQYQYERYQRSYYSNDDSNYSSSGYSNNNHSNYNDEERKLLKKVYKKMAMEFHPDRNLGNQVEAQEIMVLINNLKEQWGI